MFYFADPLRVQQAHDHHGDGDTAQSKKKPALLLVGLPARGPVTPIEQSGNRQAAGQQPGQARLVGKFNHA